MENNEIDLWDDDDFGKEFAKFIQADISDSTLYDGNISVLYCRPVYDSIKEVVNQWNKTRKQIQVSLINRAINTPNDSDEINISNVLFLDMGARLYNVLREANKKNYKHIKILKIASTVDKFDVHYYVSEYKLIVQKNIGTKKITKKK